MSLMDRILYFNAPAASEGRNDGSRPQTPKAVDQNVPHEADTTTRILPITPLHRHTTLMPDGSKNC